MPSLLLHSAAALLLGPLAPQAEASPVGEEPTSADPRLELIADLALEGRLEEARALIDELLVERDLAEARADLERGSPADALVHVDRVLDAKPRDPDVAKLKADASIALAERAIATGGSGLLIEGALEDALEHYERAARAHPRATLGAARAAYLLGRPQEALPFAREARRLLREGELAERPRAGEGVGLSQRTIAEVLYAAYQKARESADPAAQELYVETEEALANLLGRAGDDPWVWARLSDLHEWEQRFGLAREKLLEGLRRAPDDPALLERLARVARRESGPEGAAQVLARFVAANPSVALAHHLLGRERFEAALVRLEAGEPDASLFRAAEASFRRGRELDASLAESALGYEVVSRTGRGWCAFRTNDLEAARRAFLSTEELLERGGEWSVEGRLLPAVTGLAFVGDRYREQGELEAAGETFERAYELEPTNGTWANNAGFLLRDAAVELEQEGRRLCRAARGEASEEALSELRVLAGIAPPADPGAEEAGPQADERAAFRRAANERIERARELMQRSWQAYSAAAELAPGDVRVVNDTALVQVYYLHEELDQAERLLRRCLELAPEEQERLLAALAAADLEPERKPERKKELEDALWELRNAWGDAHQNLGVLYHFHRGDDERAAQHLERSVEIGPEARPTVTNILLPLVRGEREPGVNGGFDPEWGRPCE